MDFILLDVFTSDPNEGFQTGYNIFFECDTLLESNDKNLLFFHKYDPLIKK